MVKVFPLGATLLVYYGKLKVKLNEMYIKIQGLFHTEGIIR